jgi:hypothetical protein
VLGAGVLVWRDTETMWINFLTMSWKSLSYQPVLATLLSLSSDGAQMLGLLICVGRQACPTQLICGRVTTCENSIKMLADTQRRALHFVRLRGYWSRRQACSEANLWV